MKRARQVVDAVRWVMDGVIRDKSQSVAIATQYAELVDSVRRRSAECLQLIRDGLRAEAREFALRAPSLLDALAALNDPAVERWPEFCKRFGLPVPSSLSRREVEEMQEGMRALDQLGPLLDEWRVQNLRRDPVHVRLQTLWKLVKADRAGPHWREDAQSFEGPALEELALHYQRNLTLGKFDECWRLQQFLSRREWTTKRAMALSKRWSDEIMGLMPRTMRERALEVARLLHERFLEQDMEGAREHAKRFESLRAFLADTGMAVPAEVSNEADAAIQWIENWQRDEERRRDGSARFAALEALLAMQSAARGDLETALRAVEELPPDEPWDDARLAAQGRIAQLLAQERRARAMKWLGAAAAVLIVGLASAWGLATFQADRQASQAAATITQALQDGRIADADRMMAEARELGLANEALTAAEASLAEAQKARERDSVRFDTLMAQAGDPAAQGARLAAVEEAEALAFNAEQAERVRAWRETYAQQTAIRQRERDESFGTRVGELAARLAALARNGPDVGGASRELQAIDSSVRAMRSEGGISPQVRDALTPVRERAERLAADWVALEAERERSQRRGGDYAAMLRLVGDPPAYAKALRTFAQDWPEDARGAGCRRTAGDEVAWAMVLDWGGRMRPFSGKALPTDGDARLRLANAAEEHLTAHPLSPYKEEASYLAKGMRPVANALDWTEQLIQRPLMRLGEVRLKNGERYFYDLDDPSTREVGANWLIRIIPSRDELDSRDTKSIPKSQIESMGESGQAKVAKEAARILADPQMPGEERILRLWGLLVQDQRVEPLLRLACAVGLMERVREPLASSEERWAAWQRAVEDAHVGDVDWIAPSTPAVESARRKAVALLLKAPTEDLLRSDMQADRSAAVRALASSFRPVGRVVQKTDGSKVLEWLPGVPVAAGRLAVVVSSPAKPCMIVEVTPEKLGPAPAEALVFAVEGQVPADGVAAPGGSE